MQYGASPPTATFDAWADGGENEFTWSFTNVDDKGLGIGAYYYTIMKLTSSNQTDYTCSTNAASSSVQSVK